jgi:hypothetical protein
MEFNTMPFEIQIIECDLTVDEKKVIHRKKQKIEISRESINTIIRLETQS